MAHLTPIFSGKLNDDCYLFTLKVVDVVSLQSVDVGTIIINSKTDNTQLMIDNLSRKSIEDKLLKKAIEDCKTTVEEIQKIL